ncbi:hypothetical protein [Haladaptatus sp. NG-WS-4]
MLASKTVNAIGTLSIAAGGALLLLSLLTVLVGVVSVGPTVDAGGPLFRSIPTSGPVFGGPRKTFSLGVLGIGVGCWLLGLGLLLQGRVEQ